MEHHERYFSRAPDEDCLRWLVLGFGYISDPRQETRSSAHCDGSPAATVGLTGQAGPNRVQDRDAGPPSLPRGLVARSRRHSGDWSPEAADRSSVRPRAALKIFRSSRRDRQGKARLTWRLPQSLAMNREWVCGQSIPALAQPSVRALFRISPAGTQRRRPDRSFLSAALLQKR